ncbi:MAG TPA: response regulator [Bacteroidota bacterium]|nr:response regulator [Bacteroidota bacterium]
MTIGLKLNVLVAEDDSLVADIIEHQLGLIGCAVVGRATDGNQVVAQSKELSPDAVLMDIEMPGLDGLEATAEIQRTAPRPVVLLTAHESPDLVARAGRAGAGGYLVKPTTPEELERTLAIALARFGDLVELRRLNRELSDALASVKMLSGLLPICANCKKIRDDRGYWVAVEGYIMAHTEARFSHGCCPECRQKLYPGMANGG